MKNDRQSQLLQIISEEIIETQDQLLTKLRERGINSTQATISRDIKELHLIKEPAGQGVYRYTVSAHQTKLNFADKLRGILTQSILSVDNAQNLVVAKTMPGLAPAAGSALDSMNISYVLGCIAGDDTVLIITRDSMDAVEFCRELREMLQ